MILDEVRHVYGIYCCTVAPINALICCLFKFSIE